MASAGNYYIRCFPYSSIALGNVFSSAALILTLVKRETIVFHVLWKPHLKAALRLNLSSVGGEWRQFWTMLFPYIWYFIGFSWKCQVSMCWSKDWYKSTCLTCKWHVGSMRKKCSTLGQKNVILMHAYFCACAVLLSTKGSQNGNNKLKIHFLLALPWYILIMQKGF